MSQFVLNMSNCPMCASTGPALLPVRYAVVTDNIKVGIPTWAKPQNDFPQAKGYDYALRALRQGFVYVFYEMSHQWDAWAVCEDGSVWKQPSAPYAKNKKTPDCTSPLHNATNVEMMVLRDDALLGNSWLAFSPSKWGPETLERYTSNAEQREKRMQCIESWQWSEPANSEGITAASPGSLENILDYAQLHPSHASFLLPYNPPIKRISQTDKNAPWYKFEEYAVKAQGTLYPWSKSRAGYARRTLQALQVRGKGENRYGNPITPLVVALNDPVGIAHELTGFSDDFAGLHQSWMDDLSIEFMADQALNGAKNQLHAMKNALALKKTDDRVDYNLDMMKKYNRFGYSLSEEDITLWREREREREFLASESKFPHDWEKYTGKLNLQKWQAFLDCNQDFCDLLSQKLEVLATFRVAWLQESLFVACSQDFYSVRIEDNLSYQETVDYALASLNLTKSGTQYLDILIDQYSSKDERNFFWRSIMLNNPEVIEENHAFLQGMEQHKNNHEKADENTYIALATKLGSKFVKAYAKANDVIAKNPEPTSSWSRAMLASDRRLTTFGDRIFNFSRLGKRLDTMNELLSKLLFSVSSAIATVGEEVKRGVEQLVSADDFRQQLLNNLKAKASGTEKKSIQNTYKENFDKFAKSEEGATELKKVRIKLLVLAFNMLEYNNLVNKLEEKPEDHLTRATLLVTLLSTVNVASDIMKPAVEHGLKDMALTNSIKWVGNVAGTTASMMMLGVDVIGGYKEITGKLRWQYLTLSFSKLTADVGITIKALGGLFELAQNTGLRFANKELAKGIIKFSAGRLIGFLASWQVMLAVFFIEQLIIYFSDDDLQDWCEASVFGKKPNPTLISTERLELSTLRKKIQKMQEDNFNKAVKVIQ